MSLYVRQLRKDFSKYKEILDSARNSMKNIDITLKDFLVWNSDTNFIIRFDGIMAVEFKIYGFNEKSLCALDEELLSFDFNKVSTYSKREFYKFSLEELLEMKILKVRNSSSGAFVELLLDYEGFLKNSVDLF